MTSRAWAECLKVIRSLLKNQSSFLFRQPVDPHRDGVPDYLTVITKPMDLSTVEYATLEEFAEDVRQIWANTRIYNGPDHAVTMDANALSEFFEKRFQAIKKKESGPTPATAKRGTPARATPKSTPTRRDEPRNVTPIQDMSWDDKRRLCLKINNLDNTHLSKIVQIIHKNQPDIFKEYNQDTEEIPLNIEDLEIGTLRELQKYIENR